MNKYYVYKHTSPSNKVYFGITKQNPSIRWNYGGGYKNNEYFYRAIQKYGWNNFKHEILFDSLSKEDACKIEKELITQYKSNQRDFGYNIASGGEINIPSEETRRKMSISQKGKCIGKFVGDKSPKAKAVDMFDMNGDFIKTFGSTTTAEREINVSYSSIVKCCNKQRLSAGKYQWRWHSDNIKQLNDLDRVENRYKKVIQLDKENNIIKIWNSIKEASISLNIAFGSISRVCNGLHKTCGGYGWRYADVQ